MGTGYVWRVWSAAGVRQAAATSMLAYEGQRLHTDSVLDDDSVGEQTAMRQAGARRQRRLSISRRLRAQGSETALS